ncbi:hypothetical protein OG229_06080 [Streptomyces platensis]|uniref:hypothetical protein n=1 Tax=Streptomyces platensis TaxID=58346 RepID=UPI002E16780B|nr:hypothetical protein OG229_06080 [Streptomyces platensis]
MTTPPPHGQPYGPAPTYPAGPAGYPAGQPAAHSAGQPQAYAQPGQAPVAGYPAGYPAGQPQTYAQPGHAPAPGYPAGQPHPYAHPGQGPMPGYPAHPAPTQCRGCGSPAAVNFAVRAHQGLLIMMRFQKLDGPFCRSCGRSVVRQMTTRTLCLGWWSPISLVAFTPFTLLWNLVAHLKFSKLPPSTPAPGRRPMDEGAPVLRRPLAYVALIPLAWAVWVVTGVITHSG